MAIPKDVLAYNAAQTPGEKQICDALARSIDRHLRAPAKAVTKPVEPTAAEVECRIWHRHPVWFIDGNPIVGYSKLKSPPPSGSIRLLFWSGQSFDEPGLTPEGSFKAAEVRFTDVKQIHAAADDLVRWLHAAAEIQWDYKNIVKRKGRLVRVKR